MSKARSTKTPGEHTLHRASPIPKTVSYVPGYPRKLTLYKVPASRYWQVRYFLEGKIRRRSTKTENKTEAIAKAKEFYDELNYRHAQGQPLSSNSTFHSCAQRVLKDMEARHKRGELTKDTLTITRQRLNKEILPEIGKLDVSAITHIHLENLLHRLSAQDPVLSGTTIKAYMGIVRKILIYAQNARLLHTIPNFPRIRSKSQPRGYFTEKQYEALHTKATKLIGSTYHYRIISESDENNGRGKWYRYEPKRSKTLPGRRTTTVKITPELREAIVFITNSLIRPGDIKSIKHKHVEIAKEKHTYLILRHPPSKGHDQAVVTMPRAVKVYARITEHNKSLGYGTSPDDYVFFPNQQNRSHALKNLQLQFRVLLNALGMDNGHSDETHSLYSLRHTAIMFRLAFGDNIDLVTLARNARTSVEMIDKFYASHQKAIDNAAMLISHKNKRG